MLSERITTLYSLLRCNNTDVARYAGCSSGNISRLKAGDRVPKANSRSIAAFAEGVYGYADYENMLTVLRELCGASDTTREELIPSLIAWLYETEDIVLPPHAAVPKSRQARALRRQTFGAKLDRAMTVLDISNGQLAGLLNIDASLISRYRSGIYSPHGNERLSEKLSLILLSHARKKGRTSALAELCSADENELDEYTVADWLYKSIPEEDSSVLAQSLLRSLDDLAPVQGLSPARPETPDVPIASRYFGTDGLRDAAVRFLSDAAREGGELLLYSDEPMDWIIGDRAYFTLWASLMVRCVKSGVRIRIIHYVDREGAENIDAIKGWLPLYITGMIEPYVFVKAGASRFCHTFFLRPGGACIHGFFPVGCGDERWYEYITDKERLDLLHSEFNAMLSASAPFLKTYPAAMSKEYRKVFMEWPGIRNCLLSVLPSVTMPESLLTRMLARAAICDEKKSAVLSAYREMRKHFSGLLKQSGVNMILCLPDGGAAQNRRVDFSLDLLELSLDYTSEDFAEHVSAVIELVEKERNFHLTILPETPFRDIQIVTMGQAVAVLRCREPYAAFVFLNPTLTDSVSDYIAMLTEQYAEDRRTTVGILKKLRSGASEGKQPVDQVPRA